MNNLEKTDRKFFTLRRKGEAGYLQGHMKKLQKGICVNDKKEVHFFPEKY